MGTHKIFYTTHKFEEHSAHSLDGELLVPKKETEADVVHGLEELGIHLEKYEYDTSLTEEKKLAEAAHPGDVILMWRETERLLAERDSEFHCKCDVIENGVCYVCGTVKKKNVRMLN